MMTAIDYGIIAVILISSLLGWWRGFIQEISALCIWGLAIWTGWKFSRRVAVFLPIEIDNPSIKMVLAYSLLVAVILILGNLPRYLLRIFVKKVGLTRIDHIVGMLLGVARGIVIVCVFVIVTDLTSMTEQTAWQESSLIPSFQSLVLRLREQIQPEKATL